MPIKLQSAQIPYLESYVPFSTNGQTPIEDINQMFSYSVIEQEISNPTLLTYFIGGTNHTVKRMNFQNLTNNAVLRFKFSYDKSIYIIEQGSTLEPIDEMDLEPGSMDMVVVKLYPDGVNSEVKRVSANIKVSVSNLSNGNLVYFDTAAPQMELETFGDINNTITLG